MKKRFKKIMIIIFIIFILLGIWFFGDNNKEFYNIANKEYPIPGLDSSFSSQGICETPDHKYILVSGYMYDKSPSRIYLINRKSKKIEKYFTLKLNNKDFNEHAGGIETDGKNVWIVASGKLYNFSYNKLNSNNNYIEIDGVLDTFNGADFLTIDGNYLWVGEFYLKNTYETDKSHHIGNNKAICFRFRINSNNKYGVDPKPNMALSIPKKVQGMAITNDKIILSTSYALTKSHIYFYKNITNGTSEHFDDKRGRMPLYILKDSDLVKDLKIPAMSEEIDIIDNRLFIMNESSTKKYKLFTREKIKDIFSIEIKY